MKTVKAILFNILVFLIPFAAITQVTYNGKFEYIGYNDKPQKWFMPATTHYELSADSANRHSGHFSARIRFTPEAIKYSGTVYYQTIDLSAFSSYRKITVKYYFRINKGYSSWVHYFIQPENPDNLKVVDTGYAHIKGDSALGKWYQYEATLIVTPFAMRKKSVRIGFIAQAFTDMNVDDIEIYVDDKLLRDIPAAQPSRKLPGSNDIRWLTRNAIALPNAISSINPKDLSFLQKIIGNARVVALGESTHGSKEFDALRCRIINYLADNMGFEVLAFENGFTEMYIANELIKNSDYSSRKIVDSLFGRVHQTEEVVQLVDNIREKKRMLIAGVDEQKFYYPLQEIKKGLKQWDQFLYDSVGELSKYLLKYRGSVGQLDTMYRFAAGLLIKFSERKSHLATKINSRELILLEKQFQSLTNAIYLAYLNAKDASSDNINTNTPLNYRDSLMANNIVWLLNFYKTKKIILWCHNVHIQKKSPDVDSGRRTYQGNYLSKAKPEIGYKNFAFLTASGRVTGFKRTSSRAETVVIQSPYRTCYEYYLAKVPKSSFYLDLSTDNKSIQQHSVLLSGMNWRSLGYLVTPGADQFSEADLLYNFNGVFFIRNTSPSSSFHLK